MISPIAVNIAVEDELSEITMANSAILW